MKVVRQLKSKGRVIQFLQFHLLDILPGSHFPGILIVVRDPPPGHDGTQVQVLAKKESDYTGTVLNIGLVGSPFPEIKITPNHLLPYQLRNHKIKYGYARDLKQYYRLAFPSISTGVYGYPIRDAAVIALSTVVEYLKGNTAIRSIVFVLFSSQDFDVYVDSLKKVNNKT